MIRTEDNELHYDVKIRASRLLLDNIDNTFVTPVFNGSTSLRDAAGQMIENVTKSVRRKQTVDSATIDFPQWNEEIVEQRVREACEQFGRFGKGFIPCASQGGAMSTFPGVYQTITEEVDRMSKVMF